MARTRRPPASVLAGPIVTALCLVAFVGSAGAHEPQGYFTGPRWRQPTSEPYFLASGVPFVDRVEAAIVDGASQWNVPGTGVEFVHRGWSNQAVIRYPSCPADGNSYVFQENLDYLGSYLGWTWICGSPISTFVVSFDDLSWHSDTGAPPPNAFDRRSTAAHEFGHATGFLQHWSEDSTRCEIDGNRLTMCASLPQGTSMMRTLGDHDIHTLQEAYP